MRLVGLLLAAWRVLACLQDIQTLKQTSNTPQQHTKKDASPEEVPVIDMSAPAADAAARVRAACIDSGFFYVRDHGVPKELIDAAFDANRRLFALPVEEKMKLLADGNFRGYTPMAEEKLDPDHQTRGDTKEGWYMGR